MRKSLKTTNNQSNNSHSAKNEAHSSLITLQSKQSTLAQSSYIPVSDEDLDVVFGGVIPGREY